MSCFQLHELNTKIQNYRCIYCANCLSWQPSCPPSFGVFFFNSIWNPTFPHSGFNFTTQLSQSSLNKSFPPHSLKPLTKSSRVQLYHGLNCFGDLRSSNRFRFGGAASITPHACTFLTATRSFNSGNAQGVLYLPAPIQAHLSPFTDMTAQKAEASPASKAGGQKPALPVPSWRSGAAGDGAVPRRLSKLSS